MIRITETIKSRQNQKVKALLQLQKHSERVRQGVFIIEGIREIEKAILAGYSFEAAYFMPQILSAERLDALFGTNIPEQIYEVGEEVYGKIAYRENSGGIVAVAETKSHKLNSISSRLSDKPLLLVIEGIEKPGNIGAIYRTADAAGLDGIIICDSKTDLYNPNVIRASLGCIFTVPTAIATSLQALEWLKNMKIRILCTYLKEAVSYHTVDFTGSSAIVMGTEATGISGSWLEASDVNIIIPMQGTADSMNVSTSAAVIIFEACRQRGYF